MLACSCLLSWNSFSPLIKESISRLFFFKENVMVFKFRLDTKVFSLFIFLPPPRFTVFHPLTVMLIEARRRAMQNNATFDVLLNHRQQARQAWWWINRQPNHAMWRAAPWQDSVTYRPRQLTDTGKTWYEHAEGHIKGSAPRQTNVCDVY